MRIPVYIITIVAVMLLMHSCATTKKEPYDPNDLSYLYNPVRSSMNPSYRIFNESDNVSQLSIKFFTNDLDFN